MVVVVEGVVGAVVAWDMAVVGWDMGERETGWVRENRWFFNLRLKPSYPHRSIDPGQVTAAPPNLD